MLRSAVTLLVFALGASAAWASHVPGSLHLPYVYNDSWTGWPVAPTDRQHPMRSSFLDPRPSGGGGSYHIGVDINVRDDRPDQAAPPGRSHRVFAIEGGTAEIPATQASRNCSNRRVSIGHFEYWHVDTLGVLENGAAVFPGQLIGWTCRGLWHVHLSERVAVGPGAWAYVNPLHAGTKLAPFADTAPPVVRDVRFYSPAAPAWRTEDGILVSPDAGTRLSPDALAGEVDVRVLVADPQSHIGWLAELPPLRPEHHPYRLGLAVTRLWDGAVVLRRDVFVAEAHLGEPWLGPPVPFDFHYAPGTRQNVAPARCLSAQLPDCRGAYWLRLFARGDGAYWNTTREWNGPYRIAVTAWDAVGNAAAASAEATIANPNPPTFELSVAKRGRAAGAVTSAPAGISCGRTCTAALPAGTTFTLRARAARGSVFAGWSGACSGRLACEVRLSADAAVAASFARGRRGAIVGTPGDDVLVGSPARDVIRGLGGDDTIRARGGDDLVAGGGGDDRLVGGAGRDVVLGGAGRDTLVTRDRTRDRVNGGPGRDRARVDRLDRVRLVEARR